MPERKTGVHGTYLDLYPGSGYDPTVFERPTLTVDIAIFRIHESRLQLLMIERGQDPFKGLPAFPGGYVDIRNLEDSRDAAHRELEEETGIPQGTVVLKQFQTYANGARDPRWYTTDIVYYCLLSPEQAASIVTAEGASDDAAKNFWVDAWETVSSSDGKFSKQLAFDHNRILSELLNYLSERAWDRDVLFALGRNVHQPFTLVDMYDVYTAISQTTINYANFCKSFRNHYAVKALLSVARGRPGSYRPPRLYMDAT